MLKDDIEAPLENEGELKTTSEEVERTRENQSSEAINTEESAGFDEPVVSAYTKELFQEVLPGNDVEVFSVEC